MPNRKWEAVGTAGPDDWETPPDLFAALHKEFAFNVDAAACEHNALLPSYFSAEGTDAFSVAPWPPGRYFCNPPYGRGQMQKWLAMVYHQSRQAGVCVVVLCHARTDTDWWHRYAMKAREVRFIRGRLRYRQQGKDVGSSPSPSCLLVFDQHSNGPPLARRTWRMGNTIWQTV